MKNNVETVVGMLLQALSVPHITKNLRRNILSHPDYPSLQGITGVLNEYGVSNVAFRTTIEQLRQVEYPVIIYMKERNGTFGLLHGLSDKEAILSTETYEKKSYPISLFEEMWSGIAVLAEPNELSVEPTTSEKSNNTITRIAYGTLTSGLLLLAAAAGWQSQSIPFASLLVVKFIGISLVALLASHELGIESSLTDKLCTLTKSTGCRGA
jgi:ABC-type bacteriocin/lantibiotic exporter with double-glycine peptidase domain